MKTLKVMSIIGIVIFSIAFLKSVSSDLMHPTSLAYGLVLSIVGVVQANRAMKQQKP